MNYREVNEAMGEWLGSIADWDWYCTFTFRDPVAKLVKRHTWDGILVPGREYEVDVHKGWERIGWKAANNAINRWNGYMCSMLGYEETGGNPLWVACMEPQKRGVPHWHVLAENVGDVRRVDVSSWWEEHYGFARIFAYDPELGANYYLGKYVSKRLSEIRFSPALASRLARQKAGLV